MTHDERRKKVLADGGIHRPGLVMNAAEDAGIALHVACALLDMESAGGKNIFGADPGGTALPVRWREKRVTWFKYHVYRRRLRHGKVPNGVGPCQLTSANLQASADARGGCWKRLHNMQVGFEFWHTLRKQYGSDWSAFYHYNGSGSAADQYANLATSRSISWKKRLHHA